MSFITITSAERDRINTLRSTYASNLSQNNSEIIPVANGTGYWKYNVNCVTNSRLSSIFRRISSGNTSHTTYLAGRLLTGAYQFYPPYSIYESGTYYLFGKSWEDLWCYSSTSYNSGFTGVQVLAKGAPEDASKIEGGLCRKVGSTYYILYTGRNASQDDSICLATSSSIASGYSKQGSVYTVAQAQADLGIGSTMQYLSLSDVIYSGGIYHFFGTIHASNYSTGYVFYGTSNSISTPQANEIIFSYTDFPGLTGDGTFQSPGIIWDSRNSQYVMQLTYGYANSAINGERSIYMAYSNSLSGAWTLTTDVLVAYGYSGAKSDRRSYSGSWLKSMDGEFINPKTENGNILLYYSQHDLSNVYPGVSNISEYIQLPLGSDLTPAT